VHRTCAGTSICRRNLRTRYRVTKIMAGLPGGRGVLGDRDAVFDAIDPEGARDFIVPVAMCCRGSFYRRLPQSPQLFKRALMVAGCDRVTCRSCGAFGEEDRARGPAGRVHQLDVEMSFIDRENVIEIMEACCGKFGKKC